MAARPIGRAGFRSRESEAVRRFSKRDRESVQDKEVEQRKY